MEIVGCSKEKCVCFDACISVPNPQYPPCAQNAMASVPSASNNSASQKLPSLGDVRIYVQGELQKCDFDDINIAMAVSIAHEFIARQLSGE